MTAVNINLSDFIKKMAALGGEVEQAVIRGLQAAAMKFDGMVIHEIDHAHPYPAVDRGELRNSTEVVMTAQGARHQITAPHAAYLEEGTRPHRPPIAPIIAWLLRKGLADGQEASSRAWAIATKIAREGTAPRHYYRRAWERFTRGKWVGKCVGRELEILAEAQQKGRTSLDQRRGSGLRTKRKRSAT